METLHVLSGNVAVLNDIPSRYLHPGSSSAQSRDYLLPGRFRGQYVSLRLPEDSLSTGTLFLGKSRCGKTNTIFLLADQVLARMGPDDLAVFFDVKGDYQRTFYDEKNDLVLDSLSDRYAWNLFDELLPYRNDPLLLKLRVHELCGYLYKESARGAGQNRFFVDGAQAVTECLLLCLLQSDTPDSELNNASFLRLAGGGDSMDNDHVSDRAYEGFLQLLDSDPDFYSARMYLPADPDARREGYGVLSEISRMVQRVFVGSFALAAARPEQYISAESVAHRPGPTVLFLNYRPDYPSSQTYAFRFFVDSLIAGRCRFHNNHGHTYFFLDELARLPKLLYLEPAMTLMRQSNCCIVAGLQNVSQLYNVYGDREAQTILGAFQSLFVFDCDEQSQAFLQGRTRDALVQQRFVRPDGHIDCTAPTSRRCIESWDFTGLQQGECFAQLAGSSQPFRYHFTKNIIG